PPRRAVRIPRPRRRRARRLSPPVRICGGARRLLWRRRLMPRAPPHTRNERSLMTIDPVHHARRWKTLGVLSLSLVLIALDKAIAIWAALAAVGIGLGPLTGGLLLEWFDWSSVFMVNVPFAAVALLLGIRYVPESRDPRPGSFDLPGAALSTAGFSLLVYTII